MALVVCFLWGASLAAIRVHQSVSQEEVFGGIVHDLGTQTGGSVTVKQLDYNIAEGTATLQGLSIRNFIQPGTLIRHFTADRLDLTFYRPAWYSEAILEDTLEFHNARMDVHLLDFNRQDPPRVSPPTRFRFAPSYSMVMPNLRLLIQNDRLYREHRTLELEGIRLEWSDEPATPGRAKVWINDPLWGHYYAEGWIDTPNQTGCLDIEIIDGRLPESNAGDVPVIGKVLEEQFSASARFDGKLRWKWAPTRTDLEGFMANIAFREFNVRYRSMTHVPVRMRGRVRFDKGIMDARLRGTAAGGSFRAAAVISAIGEQPTFELDVYVDGADIKQIFPVDAQSELALGGRIDGALTLQGKVAREAGITGQGRWHIREGSIGALPLMFDLRCRGHATVVPPRDAERTGPPGLILEFEADKAEIWDTRAPRPAQPFTLGKTQLTWKGPPGLSGTLTGRVTDPVWGTIGIDGFLDPVHSRGMIEVSLHRMKIDPERLASVPLIGKRLSHSWSPKGVLSGQVVLTRHPEAKGGLSLGADIKVHEMRVRPRDFPGLAMQMRGDLVYRNGQLLGSLRGEAAGGTFDASCHTRPDSKQAELGATVALRDVDLAKVLGGEPPGKEAGLDLSGMLDGKVEMVLPLEDLRRIALRGEVSLTGARLGDIPLSMDLKGRADVALVPPEAPSPEARTVPHVRLRDARLAARGDEFRKADPSFELGGLQIAWKGPPHGRGRLEIAMRDPVWGHYDITGDLDLGQKTGQLDIHIIDGRIPKDRVGEVPVVGAFLKNDWNPTGRFRGRLQVVLGRQSEKSPVRINGHVELVELHVRDKMLPHNDIALKGTVRFRDDQVHGELTGTVAGGDLQLDLAIYDLFATGRSVMTVHFDNVQMAELGDPKKRPKDGTGRSGLLSGGVELTGPLSDPDNAVGPGWIKITNANLWNVPVFSAMFRAMHTPFLDPGAIGEGRLWFDARGDRFHVRRGVFNSATISIHCEGGEVGYNQRLYLTVHGWARGLEATGVPGLEQMLRALRDVVLSQLVELRVRGTLSEPEVQVVPVKIISDSAFAFFSGVLGHASEDDANPDRSR